MGCERGMPRQGRICSGGAGGECGLQRGQARPQGQVPPPWVHRSGRLQLRQALAHGDRGFVMLIRGEAGMSQGGRAARSTPTDGRRHALAATWVRAYGGGS